MQGDLAMWKAYKGDARMPWSHGLLELDKCRKNWEQGHEVEQHSWNQQMDEIEAQLESLKLKQQRFKIAGGNNSIRIE